MVVIDLQERYRRVTLRSQSDQRWAIPLKVLFPAIGSRIKQVCFFTSCEIDASDIWAFMVVAFETRQRKIGRFRDAIHLFWDDVIDLKSGWVEQLWHLAILAAVFSARPNFHSHGDGDAHDIERLRATRARD